MLLSLYYLWTAVFGAQTEIFGYSKEQMLTYVFLTAFLRSIILSTRAVDIVGEIHSGNLSNLLVKPVSVVKYYFSRDIADKGFNIFFSVFELIILWFLFRPEIYIPTNSMTWVWLMAAVTSAFMFNFFWNYLIGLWGFWVLQVWPILFISQLFSQLISGSLYPLDVFPEGFVRVINWTPFPYLLFFPANIYLERITNAQIWQGMLVISGWSIISYLVVRKVWIKGAKNYSAFGQ